MKAKLEVVKITDVAKRNFNLAAALADKKQYEVSEEASNYILGKYMAKAKLTKTKK